MDSQEAPPTWPKSPAHAVEAPSTAADTQGTRGSASAMSRGDVTALAAPLSPPPRGEDDCWVRDKAAGGGPEGNRENRIEPVGTG